MKTDNHNYWEVYTCFGRRVKRYRFDYDPVDRSHKDAFHAAERYVLENRTKYSGRLWYRKVIANRSEYHNGY